MSSSPSKSSSATKALSSLNKHFDVGEVEDGVDLGMFQKAYVIAKKAVEADNQLKYHVAADLYKQAVDMISVSIVSAASQHQDKLEDLMNMYKERLTGLEAVRPELSVIKMHKILTEQHLSLIEDKKLGSPNNSSTNMSKEMIRRTSLSVLPFIEQAGRNVPCESPPRSIHRRAYWLLRVLKTVLNNGGWLTPAVFVPSDVWRQNGAKINGYNVKLVAFQEIYETLETLHNTPLPSDGTSYKLMYNRGATNESVAKFQNVFSNCCVKILNIQTNLHRTFSYIPGVDKQLMKNDYGKGGGGSVFSGVKNFMTTAYERTTHTVVISRTTADDLEKIALVGASICEKAQFLDGWLSYFCVPGCEGKLGAKPPGATIHNNNNNKIDNRQQTICQAPFLESVIKLIHTQLQHIRDFFRKVVGAILIKDTKYLLERYLRKQRRAFVRLVSEWGLNSDDEDDDEHSSNPLLRNSESKNNNGNDEQNAER